MSPSLPSYTLVVCEKPDAARRIAHALGRATESRIAGGIPIFDVAGNNNEHYKVCSASGHLYGVADLTGSRSVYPVLDLEWAPVGEKKGKAARAARIIGTIAELSKGASRFVHACDYDQEGEVIGHSILQYACGGKYGVALRAKFSTLTDDEIRESFDNLLKPSAGLAEAGRSRHLLDFLYGVNLSRALAQSFMKAGKRRYYRNLSIGRVQGPTLAFAADRELEIGMHVPDPYWTVAADFEDKKEKGKTIHAAYEKPKVESAAEAQAIVDACRDRDGIISKIDSKKTTLRQPTPFNIGDLQREAHRLFRLSPGYTLAIAEKLYLRALISYPRTSSQKLPPSINYRKILSGLAAAAVGLYGREAGALLARERLVPHEGAMSDPAHPAIYPTGLAPRLSGIEFKLYDLIARRFLATFGDPALVERTQVAIDVAGHRFLAEERMALYDGWMALYRPYVNLGQQQSPALPPALAEGDVLACRQVTADEKFTQPPWRYSQASLLARMEQEKIGTKATRADIIATLFKREYLAAEKGAGGGIRVTDLGLAVVDSMRERVPAIVSTGLTRSMEEELERVERGEQVSAEVIGRAVDSLIESLAAFRESQAEIGRQIRDGAEGKGNAAAAQRQAAAGATITAIIIGQCPLCKTGQLRVITSKTTKKRFAGCSNYSPSEGGCKATAPLPQRGGISGAGKACQCGWPIIAVAFGRRAKRWNVCVNMQCPYKKRAGAPS